MYKYKKVIVDSTKSYEENKAAKNQNAVDLIDGNNFLSLSETTPLYIIKGFLFLHQEVKYIPHPIVPEIGHLIHIGK